MQCSNCKALSPDDKKYCGDCGAELTKVDDFSSGYLNQRIKTAIKEQLADQKVVEVELTEAVLQRITAWGKILAYFAGIPLALLFLVLGALGIKQYADIQSLANAAEKTAGPVLERAVKQAGEVEKKTQDLIAQSEAFQRRLADLQPKLEKITADSERLAGLDSRVAGIEGEVRDIKGLLPGVERWAVKTGADPDASLVRAGNVNTTVAQLASLPRPSEFATGKSPQFQNHRLGPHELTIYTVEAYLTAVKLESDGDFHMVLDDGNGNTIVAEVPNPDPSFVSASSRWAKDIAGVRAEVAKKLTPEQTAKRMHLRVRVTGVGFYDLPHGQLGMAKNGVEIHPVTAIEFLE